jgi:hypothetical protein
MNKIVQFQCIPTDDGGRIYVLRDDGVIWHAPASKINIEGEWKRLPIFDSFFSQAAPEVMAKPEIKPDVEAKPDVEVETIKKTKKKKMNESSSPSSRL